MRTCPYSHSHTHTDAPGGLATMTDQAVNAWLAQHHPAVALDLRREQARVELQIRKEIQAGSAPEGCEIGEELTHGTHYTALGLPEQHYLFTLFPGCGRAEICDLARAFLTPGQHQALCATFRDGQPQAEASAAMGGTRHAIGNHLRRLRLALVRAAGQFTEERKKAEAAEPVDPVNEIEALMQAPTMYQRPSHRPHCRAYVCDCGRHVDWRHKPHRQGVRGAAERYTCGCGRRYTGTERRKLAA